jgi:hypothetical protein
MSKTVACWVTVSNFALPGRGLTVSRTAVNQCRSGLSTHLDARRCSAFKPYKKKRWDRLAKRYMSERCRPRFQTPGASRMNRGMPKLIAGQHPVRWGVMGAWGATCPHNGDGSSLVACKINDSSPCSRA